MSGNTLTKNGRSMTVKIAVSKARLQALEKRNPEEYRRLFASSSLPEPPQAKVQALVEEAKLLRRGEKVSVPAPGLPLLIEGRLVWDLCDGADIDFLGLVPMPNPISSRQLRALAERMFHLLEQEDTRRTVEDLREVVWKSSACRAFVRKVKKFNAKVSLFARKYEFNYDEEIDDIVAAMVD